MRLSCLALVCLLITACGFQLRGEARLPAVMDRTVLEVADETSAFARELSMQLQANGVTLVDGPAEGAALLRIHDERMQREALTITGQARVREFQVVFEIDYELLDGAGEPLVERETLRMSRDYSFDEQAILAAEREQEFLESDLRRSMAMRVLRRLEAAEPR